ncbi:hypothetical protein L3049_03920 [Labilibaculum sp. DW002]|uniref:Uncharacterized protein n=1 Tax=Paralabilibaculum antarcticum TaxID=2912572 RepID=A0ABT5VNX8_9BACT|nr:MULTISPECIES: hypothetical protein [unclassified Labilibaculum]MBI9057421.1 hypothetical protein [Labilibaculum sp.]MDE5417146.1 hypothetical protein [Labilibaculum sp. DW002]
MDNVYTLFKLDCKNAGQEIFNLMDRIGDSDVFESNDLIDYLDKHRVDAKSNLVHRILGFRQSTKNVNLKIPDLAEITLN